MVHGSVAVHDDFAVIHCRIQELIANPEQIFWILLPHGNARPDSRVNKQKISADEAVAQALEKQVMCARKSMAQRFLKFDRR